MMSALQLTHRQAVALAKFLHELRGDWDVPGIEHALGKARHLASGPELAHAAIRAAGSVSNRTPAIIPLDGAHWRASEGTPPRRRLDRAETCRTCGWSQQRCEVLRGRNGDDHDFEPLTVNPMTGELAPDTAEAMRLAIAEAQVAPAPEPAPLTERHDALGLPDPDVLREPEPASTEGDS